MPSNSSKGHLQHFKELFDVSLKTQLLCHLDFMATKIYDVVPLIQRNRRGLQEPFAHTAFNQQDNAEIFNGGLIESYLDNET
ncbi:hypothetical protein M514_03298 [Trichuris suis]|uniref:Uncharacterized protein n=1 Tax=Trichuris suis TaxID=68888 RepID=A0A085MF63_9BILA|nr:hypothetical protein M513_03298 [Trichuris suis]KFD70209.1 hypothetical protein M514_03298 [Trichuris suis]